MSLSLERIQPKKINNFMSKILQSSNKLDVWLFVVTILYFLLNLCRPSLIISTSIIFILILSVYFIDKWELYKILIKPNGKE